MTTGAFAITVHVEGEVRAADGTLISTTEGTTDEVQVTFDQLADAVRRNGTTDEQLRQLGINEDTITQIRSTS